MAAPLNLGRKALYDYDKGRRGVFIYKHEVNTRDLPEHVDTGYQIEFVPKKDMFASTISYTKMWTSFRNRVDKVSVTTDEIYSENALIETSIPWSQDYAGVPEEGVILLQNVEEEAKLMERIGNKREAKLEMMERKLSEEKMKNIIETAKNKGQKGSKRAASDRKEPRRRRDRRRKDRKRKKKGKNSGRGRGRNED